MIDVSKLLEKARECAERRNYEMSVDLYMQACKLAPDHAQARNELRAVENRMAKEKGTSFFGKAQSAMALTNIKTLMAMKKYDSAAEKAEEALKKDPGNVSLLMALGRSCKFAGHKQSATATFEYIKASNGSGDTKQLVEGLRELAGLYEEANRITESLDIWTTIGRHVPGDRDASTKYRDLSAKSMHAQIEGASKAGSAGSIARTMQNKDQAKTAANLDREKGEIKSEADLVAAIQATLEDIQKRPDDAQYYSKLGDLYKQGNNYDEAKKSYEAAKQKDPNNPMWVFKGHDLEIWKMENSFKNLAAKVKAGDQTAKEQYEKERLGLLQYKIQSYTEREKQYSTDSRIRFELGKYYFDLAQLNKDKALYDEAIKRFQSTFNDPKFRVDSGMRLGVGFANKGQYDLSIKRFDETLASIPKEIKDDRWKNLMYFKGDTLERCNRKREALTIFLEIYEVQVDFKDVAKRVERLQEEVGPQGGDAGQA